MSTQPTIDSCLLDAIDMPLNQLARSESTETLCSEPRSEDEEPTDSDLDFIDDRDDDDISCVDTDDDEEEGISSAHQQMMGIVMELTQTKLKDLERKYNKLKRKLTDLENSCDEISLCVAKNTVARQKQEGK